MKSEERLGIFRINLTTVLNAGEGAFVIFNANNRFVQFASGKSSLWIDLPLVSISKEEEEHLLHLGMFSTDVENRDPNSGNLLSYQARYEENELEKAVLLTERIFLDVFRFSPDYDVTPELGRFSQSLDHADVKTFDLNNLDGHEFESLIESLIKKMGFTVDERKLTADGGIDILAHSHEPLFEGKYIIQCKRYAQKIPEHPVRDLYGVVHSESANKGILITNSAFTPAAMDFAKGKQIELIDGMKLWNLLSKYDLLKFKGGAKLDVIAAYLLYNFLPNMKNIRDYYKEIRTGNIYLEKTPAREKGYYDFLLGSFQATQNFVGWWAKTWTQLFEPSLKEKPPNLQKIKDINHQLDEAIRKITKTYKALQETLPPARFSVAHEKLQILFEDMFEMIFKPVEELEKLSSLNIEQLKEKIRDSGSIDLRYNIFYPESWRTVLEALKQAKFGSQAR